MTFTSTVTGSFRALRRNPTRAMLTTLGIVIGIAAVITMMEIGNGSATAMKRNLENMGATTLVIMPGAPRRPGMVSQGKGAAVSLTPDDCRAIQRDCVNVSYVAPIVNAAGLQLVFAGKNWTPRQTVGTGRSGFQSTSLRRRQFHRQRTVRRCQPGGLHHSHQKRHVHRHWRT